MANTHISLGQGNEETILATYYTIVSSALGVISYPTGGALVQDAFQDLEDAVVSTVSSGSPTFNAATSSGGSRCVAYLDSNGNYSISPSPSAYPVALVYRVKLPLSQFEPTSNVVLEDVERAGGGGAADIANIGSGTGIYSGLSGTTAQLKSLIAGTNTSITSNATSITISSTASGSGNSYNPSGW